MGILFHGLILVTGERDVGKTTFALQSGAEPEKTGFFDGDLKSSSIVEQLRKSNRSFGVYHDLVSLKEGKTEVPYYKAVMELIDGIKDNSLDTFIWDNPKMFQDALHAVVLVNPNNYKTDWASMGQIKGAQQWQQADSLFEHVVNKLKKKANLVIITAHLKTLTLNNVRTEKLIPDISRSVYKDANLAIWLRMNDRGGGRPNGLILKRFQKLAPTQDNPFNIENVLPRKMVPCTWEEIRKYWNEPFGEKEPEKDQKPNQFELSILDGHLTPDQRKSFELMLQYGTGQASEEEVLSEVSTSALIQEYVKNNPGSTAPQVKAALNLDKSIPEIAKIMANAQKEE